MLENIETIFQERCLLVKNRPIVVGVSGGPDSLCLMEALRQAGYSLIVAHFNHRLRPEADIEATAVEHTASRLMIPSVVESADVRAYAGEQGMSIEEAARHLRYRFLFALARKHSAQAVAVAHTADDQVETILMHFLRGAGLTGLKGMTYRTILPSFDAEIPIVRPLLDVWREEVVVYCAANGLRPSYDSSNDSLNFLRNRIRHLLIPTLETYNPNFRQAVWRSAQSLAADHALLMELIELAWKECVLQQSEDVIVFDIPALRNRSAGLQRNLFRRAVEQLRPGQETTFAVLERAVSFLQQSSALRLDWIGGLRLFREGNQLYLATSVADLPFDRWPQMPADMDVIHFSVPAVVEIAGGWKLTCERWRIPALAREQAGRSEDPFQVWLDAENLPERFELRVRRSGDRFEPLGMDGHSQKISDFFVNVKMPQRARARWPLLCAGEQVIWVPGYRLAHAYRLLPTSKTVLYFALSRPVEKSASEM
jgi:tRNA(Ile)-lysidine synthase